MSEYDRLQWIKTVSTARVWVDRAAFYCVRERLSQRKAPYGPLHAPEFEAYETYPHCRVALIGIAATPVAAKALCQAHADKLVGEEAA